MTGIASFQIGKMGVTSGVVTALNSVLKNHKHVRVSTLPSSGRNRESIKKMAEDLVSKLAFPCAYTIIGFKIILRRRIIKVQK